MIRAMTKHSRATPSPTYNSLTHGVEIVFALRKFSSPNMFSLHHVESCVYADYIVVSAPTLGNLALRECYMNEIYFLRVSFRKNVLHIICAVCFFFLLIYKSERRRVRARALFSSAKIKNCVSAIFYLINVAVNVLFSDNEICQKLELNITRIYHLHWRIVWQLWMIYNNF